MTKTTNGSLSKLNDDQHIAWMFLAQDYAKKIDGWNVNLIDKFPRIHTIREPIIAGTFGWTFTVSRSKMLLNETALLLGENYHTPSGIARDYLKLFYTKKRRAFLAQKRAIMDERSAPLFAVPGFYREMVYADIRSTYFQIMLNVGWDVDYYPGEFLLAGRAPIDFPFPEHKIARNCVFSASYLQDMELWTGNAWTTKRNGSPLVNFCLIAYVLDILHAIAITALGLGAIYIHTDGYILPLHNLEKLKAFTSELGLDLRIKAQGNAHVCAVGCYSVGDVQTATYGKMVGGYVNTLRPVDIPFLVEETNHIVTRGTANTIYTKGH